MKKEIKTKDYIERIKFLMWKHKLNQSQLAKDIGVTNGLLSGLLNAKSVPTLRTLEKIAQKFKVQPVWLLGAGEIKDECKRTKGSRF